MTTKPKRAKQAAKSARSDVIPAAKKNTLVKRTVLEEGDTLLTVKKRPNEPKREVKAKPRKSTRPATDEQILKAIDESDGIISDAAKALGYTRPALSARINKSLELKIAVEEASENLVDMAVGGLRKAVKNGDVTACIYITKTLGKKRGFSERQEIDLRGKLTTTDVDLSKLSNEELDELIRLGKEAGGDSAS